MINTKLNKFPQLETERLNLLEFSKEDLSDFFLFNSRPSSLQYIPRDPFTKSDQAKKKLNEFHQSFYQNTGIWWTFKLKSNNSFIGYGGIFKNNSNQIEIGYALLEKYHAKGYAKEAINNYLNFCFGNLNFEKIYARIDKNNTASIKLATKMGFHLEDKKSEFIRSGIKINELLSYICNKG